MRQSRQLDKMPTCFILRCAGPTNTSEPCAHNGNTTTTAYETVCGHCWRGVCFSGANSTGCPVHPASDRTAHSSAYSHHKNLLDNAAPVDTQTRNATVARKMAAKDIGISDFHGIRPNLILCLGTLAGRALHPVFIDDRLRRQVPWNSVRSGAGSCSSPGSATGSC